MQSSMPWPPAGPSSDLVARPGPSHSLPRASHRSSRVVGHFDADELTHRLQQILSNQRAHEERQRRHHKTDEAQRRPQPTQQLQPQQQQQQEHPYARYIPREAARQFSRTATSASTLHAMQEPTPAMRFNQGLPVVAAPAHVRSPSQPTYTQFQFPFSSASSLSISSHPQQSGGPVSSTDSTPPPPPPPPPAALRLPLNAGPQQKQGKQKHPEWTPSDSAATTVLGHVSVSVSTPAPAGPMGAAAARGSKGPAVWTPLLRKADSLWGLRGRSRTGSKGSLREMVEGSGRGKKGAAGEGVLPAGEVVEAGEGGKAGKGGKRFFGKFR